MVTLNISSAANMEGLIQKARPCIVFNDSSNCLRRGFNQSLRFKNLECRYFNQQMIKHTAFRRPRLCASAATSSSQLDMCTAYQEVLKTARKKFHEEVSFSVEDRCISLSKVMLLIAAEDEAFLSLNRERDIQAFRTEGGREVRTSDTSREPPCLDSLLLSGKTIGEWLSELDMVAKEVEIELVSKDIGCYLSEVLEAVNFVLFDARGFSRTSLTSDPKQSYLHTVLNSAAGSAIILSIIYIEVCQRLGVSIVGAGVGEDFLIWPKTENTEELFRLSEGESWFAKVNGNCVKHPGSRAFDLNSSSLPNIETGSKRDIIVAALANLKRLYWKYASKAHPGLLLTSPLRPLHVSSEHINKVHSPNALLLRPQELRLAIMASERMLILQPDNWTLRRDHGMLLYYGRRFGEALQELSICMAFAPVEEAQILEPFVEKLHLMRVESSWSSLKPSSTLSSRT